MDNSDQTAAWASHTASQLSINLSQALVEARRCLYCYDAPCAQACPVHIDVSGFIKRLAEQNLEGSYRLLVDANPLATICGAVCPTLDLCEGACVLSKMGQRPIRIGALQYFVSSRFQYPESVPPSARASRRRIAVIGGGPSGIGCAVTLRRLGHEVHVYERAPALGGLLSQVIPAHRLPQEVVEHDLSRLAQSGIVFRPGEEADGRMVKAVLQEYDALFLGIGLAGSTTLAVPGVELPGVASALDFLEQARLYAHGKAPPPAVGGTVVIVGGGNAALDAATTAKGLGAEQVIVLYRRTITEMPAWHNEYIEAAALGIEFRWLSTITAVAGDKGGVRAVQVQPMRRTALQADGRRGVEPDPRASPYELTCDTVLLALGQSLGLELVTKLGLPVSEDGSVLVDPQSFQTAQPKIFAAGEAVSGGSTVVASLAQGMAAGRAIHDWLSREGPGGE